MIPKDWNWLAMFYNDVNLITDFLNLKKILYWWSYGVWNSLCNDFSKITIVKNTCCDMITMWKHDYKNWNWMSMFYNVANLIADFFKPQNILYWWSYGVWNSLCNNFPKITMVKNTCCDMITMWKHDSKKLELDGNVLQCCKLDCWIF